MKNIIFLVLFLLSIETNISTAVANPASFSDSLGGIIAVYQGRMTPSPNQRAVTIVAVKATGGYVVVVSGPNPVSIQLEGNGNGSHVLENDALLPGTYAVEAVFEDGTIAYDSFKI